VLTKVTLDSNLVNSPFVEIAPGLFQAFQPSRMLRNHFRIFAKSTTRKVKKHQENYPPSFSNKPSIVTLEHKKDQVKFNNYIKL